MRPHLTVIFVCVFSFISSAQLLTLKSKNKEKSFPSLHELTIYAATGDPQREYFRYNGKLLSASVDSITLNLSSWIHNLNDESGDRVMHEHHFKNSVKLPDFVTVAKKDIYEIEDYKSDKKAKGRRTRSKIGQILVFGSMFAFASSYALDTKSERRKMRILSAASFGTAIVIGASSSTPDYDTRHKWQIMHK